MDRINIYPEWKKTVFDMLCIVFMKLTFLWNVSIVFVNIL